MISPICPTQKERPRGPPQTNIWGESLVGLPTRLDLMERRGIDYHRRRVFVCPGSICSYNLRHTIPSRRRVLSFRQLLLSSLVKKTAQVCSKWELHLHQPTSGQRPGGEIVQVQQGMVGVPAGDSCVTHNHRLHEVTMARPCFAAPRSPAQLDTRTLLFSLFVLLKAVLIFLPKSYLSTSTCHYKSLDQTTNTPNHFTHTLQDGLP